MLNYKLLALILVFAFAAAIYLSLSFKFLTFNPTLSFPANKPTNEAVKNLNNLIRLEKLLPGQLVSSPLVVTGQARGNWYFEASFPISIYDADGIELGVVVAQADGEWMTKEFVPFNAVLSFKKPATSVGTLVLYKNNPSGLSEYDTELRIPIKFDLTHWTEDACKATGCSRQICSDQEVVTTCEFKNEYVCYRTARCERQKNGQCGWTPTEELVACLGTIFQAEPSFQ